jgi:Transposase domain (DUF772)
MRPGTWRPPVEPSSAEQAVMKAVRRARLFVFLRQHRHELFDEEFQAELAEMYADSAKGQPPVPPAQLALATILQACTGVSDDEVIEAAVMDRRWQLALSCMDAQEPPFSKGCSSVGVSANQQCGRGWVRPVWLGPCPGLGLVRGCGGRDVAVHAFQHGGEGADLAGAEAGEELPGDAAEHWDEPWH